jgi:hydroxymethylbilane synthase
VQSSNASSSQPQADIVARIGTRGSPLALVQAHEVRDRLANAHGLDPARIAIEVIRTTGDAVQNRLLADLGGKGLFTKEIEEALLAGRIDLAVHSAKDVPTFLPDDLHLAAWLPREDVRDVFIGRSVKSLRDLPHGATLGTASARRQAMVLRHRPDLKMSVLRGNVETRLRKLQDGEAEGTLLALAGLKRLGLQKAATEILSVEDFLPAVGQGAIAIETRRDDDRINSFVSAINDSETNTALACERSFLALLDGSCRTPIGGHCTVTNERISFRGLIISPDGQQTHEGMREGTRSDAVALGADLAKELRARAGEKFFTLFSGA